MLPGKTYTPEDVLQIARRHIWVLLVPFAVIAAGTAVWARFLPDQYRSESTIQVVPQRVPESFVRSTVTTRIEDRLQAIQQQVLSRPRLEQIINKFDLYTEERETGIMEDVVERMRTRDIRAQILPSGEAFRISFVGDNPLTVQRVTEELATSFINKNLDDRKLQSQGTDLFLESELGEAHRSLLEQEATVEEYKRRYAGQLPSQLESNLQVLQNAQMQIQQVVQMITSNGDRQIRLERDILDLEQQLENAETGLAAVEAQESSAAQRLAAMEDQLALLLLTKKDTYPDVRRLQAAIAELKARLAEQPEIADTPVSPDLHRPALADDTKKRRLDDLRLELRTVKRNIANATAEEQRLRQQIAVYQQRNEAIPTRESEMTEMLRTYGTMNQKYLDLLRKSEDAKLATNLENRQIGETFNVIDPARFPERPFSPDRHRLNAMGLAGGLGVSLLLVAFIEYRDRSFKTDGEVVRLLSLPVLAVVPQMQSSAERTWALRKQLAMAVGCGSTVLACLAVVAYTFVR